MTDLDDRLKEHYRAQSLSEEALESLSAHTASTSAAGTHWGKLLSKVQPNLVQMGVAACLLLLVSAFVHNIGVHAERTDRAVQEVAMNHTTRFELEFEDSSINKIDQQMALLPFDVSLPASMTEKFKVKGARYCSLSGQLAAHVKLIDRSSNKPVSVFMTRASDELGVIDNSTKDIDGVNVQIWRESGLLYAKVGSFEPGDTQ